MKKLIPFLVFVMIAAANVATAQSVGIGTTAPDASAVLDITNTSKGLLIPRMNGAAVFNIANPAKGLMVYDSLTNQLMVNTGSPSAPDWQQFVFNSNAWSLTGNGVGANQFIGSLSFSPLRFRVNNTWAGEINPQTQTVSLGLNAGQSNTGFNNIAIGAFALLSNTISASNIAIGNSALRFNTNGFINTAIGDGALSNNTVAEGNIAIGASALSLQNGGTGHNTAVGNGALFRTTASAENTAVGHSAATNFNLGFNNTFIGANSDANQNGLFNCVAIGESSRCTASSQVRFGNTFTTSIGGFVGYSNLSDGRYKKNIQETVKGIDFIMKLRPVMYQLDIAGINRKLNINDDGKANDPLKKEGNEKTIFSGFVAQEVEQAAKAAGYDFSGVDKPKNENDMYGLRYAEFVVPLVKAMQEQQQIVNELKKQNTDLQKRVLALEKK